MLSRSYLPDNTHIGAVFLGGNMLIRRFAREAAQLYRLVATDVGSPLSGIKSNLEGEELLSKAQAVIDAQIPFG